MYHGWQLLWMSSLKLIALMLSSRNFMVLVFIVEIFDPLRFDFIIINENEFQLFLWNCQMSQIINWIIYIFFADMKYYLCNILNFHMYISLIFDSSILYQSTYFFPLLNSQSLQLHDGLNSASYAPLSEFSRLFLFIFCQPYAS